MVIWCCDYAHSMNTVAIQVNGRGTRLQSCDNYVLRLTFRCHGIVAFDRSDMRMWNGQQNDKRPRTNSVPYSIARSIRVLSFLLWLLLLLPSCLSRRRRQCLRFTSVALLLLIFFIHHSPHSLGRPVFAVFSRFSSATIPAQKSKFSEIRI